MLKKSAYTFLFSTTSFFYFPNHLCGYNQIIFSKVFVQNSLDIDTKLNVKCAIPKSPKNYNY